MPGDFASWDRQSRGLARRRRALAGPVLVPVSMAAAFTVLDRLLGPRRSYNAGFALYWAGWCFAFPLWVLGGRRAMRVLSGGTRPPVIDAVWLVLPVAGAATAELLPNRRAVDRKVAVMMAGSALVNAVGEELLWRGAYLDTLRGCVAGGDLAVGGLHLVAPGASDRAPFTSWPRRVPGWGGGGGSGIRADGLDHTGPALDPGSAYPDRHVRGPGGAVPAGPDQ
jgi:hypothetical protein